MRCTRRLPDESRVLARRSRTAPGGDQADRLGQQLVLDRGGSRSSSCARSRVYGTSTARCRMIGPESTPSSTKWTVTPVTLTPCVERLPDRIEAGERGQQRRVDVDDPVAEPRHELRREQLHVAGEHDQVDARAASSQSPIAASRAPRSACSRARRPPSRPRRRAPARAPSRRGLFEATPTTSIPSRPCSRSRIACRLVPVPEARTATRNALTRQRAGRGPTAMLLERELAVRAPRSPSG